MFGLMPYANRNHSVSSYNPFADMDELEKAFFGNHAIAEFKTDIRDNGDSYTLEADLPGFSKDDIKVDAENGYLTITAERHSETEDKEGGKNHYVRRERSYGSFTRSFDITGIQSDNIEASYADGVLKLNLPKKAPEKPTAKRLEIK